MPLGAMGRPRPRNMAGLNPLLKNKRLGKGRQAFGGDASVVPPRMAQGALGARKQALMARAGAAKSMRSQGGVA